MVKCKDCMWWQTEDGHEGICIRHAPRPQTMLFLIGGVESKMKHETKVGWPQTDAKSGCGDFAARD